MHHALIEFLFSGRVLGLPKACLPEFVGQILLRDEVLRIVVCIFISVGIPQFAHQFGRGIA